VLCGSARSAIWYFAVGETKKVQLYAERLVFESSMAAHRAEKKEVQTEKIKFKPAIHFVHLLKLSK
jgi:hypothetical protein